MIMYRSVCLAQGMSGQVVRSWRLGDIRRNPPSDASGCPNSTAMTVSKTKLVDLVVASGAVVDDGARSSPDRKPFNFYKDVMCQMYKVRNKRIYEIHRYAWSIQGPNQSVYCPPLRNNNPHRPVLSQPRDCSNPCYYSP